MNADTILAKMRKHREFVVDLGDAKRVTLRRPTELQIQTSFIKLKPPTEAGAEPTATIMADPESVHTLAVSWDGFTEADLIGSAGSSDEAPFDTALLKEWLDENPAKTVKLMTGLLDAIVTHVNSKADAEKN